MSTTNDLVIRMRCGNGDTVGRKWGNGKGLREGRGFEKVEEICRRVKNCKFREKGMCLDAQTRSDFGDRIWAVELHERHFYEDTSRSAAFVTRTVTCPKPFRRHLDH